MKWHIYSQMHGKAIYGVIKICIFQVKIYDDLPYDRIMTTLRSLQTTDDSLSCLALFILTHGEENGILHSYDKPYRLDKNIIHELLPANCPGLSGKPKLLFIQVKLTMKTHRRFVTKVMFSNQKYTHFSLTDFKQRLEA